MAYPFIQARNYTPTTGRKIDLIVVHTMESPEKPDTAENVARWFAGPTAPRASAHYCIDSNSIVQCVKDKDVAWAAPNANRNGLHFELAGKAAQIDREWDDTYSKMELALAAKLGAEKALLYGLPVVWLEPKDILAGGRGFTSHNNVTKAYPGTGTHWDPGPNFPVADYMRAVRLNLKPPLADVGTYAPPWPIYKRDKLGWKQIANASLLNPVAIMRMRTALRDAGHYAPYTARIKDGPFIATGKLYEPEFIRRISGHLKLGRDVTVDDIVLIRTRKV